MNQYLVKKLGNISNYYLLRVEKTDSPKWFFVKESLMSNQGISFIMDGAIVLFIEEEGDELLEFSNNDEAILYFKLNF